MNLLKFTNSLRNCKKITFKDKEGKFKWLGFLLTFDKG
jgi:hypothetical protein